MADFRVKTIAESQRLSIKESQKLLKIFYSIIIILLIINPIHGQTESQRLSIWLPDEHQKILRTYIPLGVDVPPELKFYNHTPAFQMDGGLLWTGVNPAANPDPYGNANRDFPWAVTSGLHLSNPSTYKVYKAANIPGPISYYQGRTRLLHNLFFKNEPPPTVWIYPEGTQFFEFLVNNRAQTFEVRKRTKQLNGDWVPEVYRPFKSVDELPNLYGVPPHLYSQPVSRRIKDVPGQIDAIVDMIKVPHIDLPFHIDSESGQPISGPGGTSAIFRKSSLIITTDEDNNYIPKNFMGNITNCTACHMQAQKHSRQITPNREWYGNVRGSDQIFSFNVFDESSIDYGGFIRPKFFRRGLTLIQISPR